MILVKGNTKKGEQLLRRARVWEGEDLFDVYGSVSANKGRAFSDCCFRCKQMNGRNFHICSHNTFQFSVTWEFDSPETGELMTWIETASNIYIVDGSR